MSMTQPSESPSWVKAPWQISEQRRKMRRLQEVLLEKSPIEHNAAFTGTLLPGVAWRPIKSRGL